MFSNYKEKMFELGNKYSKYLIMFIIFSPIFISLDFSQGLKFDGYYFHQYTKPSIPLSIILIGILALVHIKRLVVKKELRILIVILFIYMIINVYFSVTRSIIVGIGMILPIITYYIFNDYAKKLKINYNRLFQMLFLIIILKFLFDIYLYQLHLFQNQLYTGQVLQNTIFSTPFYLYNKIIIYSYYDYFPFLYYIATVFSLFNIIKKQFIKSSLFLILVSNIVILDTGSRLFIYGIYLIPLLLIFFYVSKFSLKTSFNIFISIVIIVTFILGFYNLNFSDVSLLSRNSHALRYFQDFSLINLILPFINEHRINSIGSLHNEFLEIWSFFGLIIFYYLYLLKKMFSNINEEYKLISFLLMFILIIGMLIQINFCNPYVGIILGMILGILSKKEKGAIPNE